jgi:leader peptidase (prepilin peptidase) / N-methyltransferase
MDLLPIPPDSFVAVSVFIGLAIGSFLNVVIHRLPRMMEQDWAAQCADLRGEPPPENEPFSIVRPRSRCPECGHQITAMENIPIVSYLMIGGRCRGCGKRISWRYPLVEALTGLMFGVIAWKFGPTVAAAGAMLFVTATIALTFIDFDTQYLPDDITLPLVWAGLLINLTPHGFAEDIRSAVLGAAVGYMTLWTVAKGYFYYRRLINKLLDQQRQEVGMGNGDFKLLAAIGAWFGWQMLPVTTLLSSVVGALVGIILMVLTRQGRDLQIPFGPYLAIAGVIALFWGKTITQAYLGLW